MYFHHTGLCISFSSCILKFLSQNWKQIVNNIKCPQSLQPHLGIIPCSSTNFYYISIYCLIKHQYHIFKLQVFHNGLTTFRISAAVAISVAAALIVGNYPTVLLMTCKPWRTVKNMKTSPTVHWLIMCLHWT